MKQCLVEGAQYQSRSAAISIARLVSMLLIVACHYLQYYSNGLAWWLNVGVQVFFVISGYLYGIRDIDNPLAFFKRVFPKILVPYYTLLIVILPFYLFCFPEFLSVKKVVGMLVCSDTVNGLGHLWFVGYILFCYLITPVLFWLRKTIPSEYSPIKVISVYIVILLLVQILGSAYGSYFIPARISCYLVGFFAADLVARYGSRVEKYILIVFFSAALLMSGMILSGRFDCIENHLTLYNHLAMGVTLFFGLKTLFGNCTYSPLLLASDKYSYHIYLVHQIFILSPFALMKATVHPTVNVIISLAAIVLSGVVLQKIAAIVSRLMFYRSN